MAKTILAITGKIKSEALWVLTASGSLELRLCHRADMNTYRYCTHLQACVGRGCPVLESRRWGVPRVLGTDCEAGEISHGNLEYCEG